MDIFFDTDYFLLFGTFYTLVSFFPEIIPIFLYICKTIWLTIISMFILGALLGFIRRLEQIIEYGVNRLFEWAGFTN